VRRPQRKARLNGMNQYIVNLSGQSIPPNTKIIINGEAQPRAYLVIENYSRSSGTATWKTEAEFNAQSAPSVSSERPAWAAPLKPKAPYS
jgi:hypothetical protein